jgi:hypothetical protein
MIDTQCRGLVNKLAREFFQIDAWEVPASRVEVMYNNCRERPWITASFTPSLIDYAEENWKEVAC